MKKIILIIITVVTMLGISACGDKQSNQSIGTDDYRPISRPLLTALPRSVPRSLPLPLTLTVKSCRNAWPSWLAA